MGNFFQNVGNALTGGVFGLISDTINNARQKKAEQRQFNYQKELMNIQNQQTIDFWNMQNDYNSPANQRKLAEEAGLNPDFYFSNGNAFTPSQMGQAAQGSAPDTGYSAIEGERMYNNAVQNSLWRANAQNAMEDAHLKSELAHSEEVKRSLMQVEKLMKEAQTRGIDLDNDLMKKTLETQIQTSLANLRKLEADTAYTERHTSYLNFQEDMQNMQFQENVRMNNEKIKNFMHDRQLSIANRANIIAQTALHNYLLSYRQGHLGFAPGEMSTDKLLGAVLTEVAQKYAPAINEALQGYENGKNEFWKELKRYLREGAEYAIKNGMYAIP